LTRHALGLDVFWRRYRVLDWWRRGGCGVGFGGSAAMQNGHDVLPDVRRRGWHLWSGMSSFPE
jgi:hypothetical protein